jgi:hypothetical protein
MVSSAADVSGAAENGHEQILDAHAHVEWRRADESLHVGVEPAGESGEQRCNDEGDEPDAKHADA